MEKHLILGTLIVPEVLTDSGYIWSEESMRQAIQELMALYADERVLQETTKEFVKTDFIEINEDKIEELT